MDGKRQPQAAGNHLKIVPPPVLSGSRKLPNWIDGFVKYTEGKGSPLIWRKWAAIFTLAAAVERKVWITTAKGQLFPNLYVVMVGSAGSGKSLATNTVHSFLRVLRDKGELYLAPASITKASMIDRLNESARKVVRLTANPPILTFNSLAVVPNELGVFLPAYDNEFMSTLTDLWDCNHYSETRRTNKISIDIPHAQLNIFSATTPSYLNGFLPEGAWDQGFMSRVICVYSGASEYTDIFAEFDHDETLRKELDDDLASINKMCGKLTFTEEAMNAIRAWAIGGYAPVPSHPKLTHYNTRRPAQLLKLCMIAAIASGEQYEITLDHYAEAIDWLSEAEGVMPDIFKAMKTGGDGRIMEECYHFVYEQYMKEKKPILEHRIYHFVSERTPSHNVERLVGVMVKANMLQAQMTDAGTGYIPRTKSTSY